jgi:Domain of unknown function (DUF4440)
MRFARYALHIVLVTTVFGAMTRPAHADQSSQESEIVSLSDAWIEAEVRHDTEALEHLLDERFMATLASGQTIDRAAFIDLIRKSDIKPFQVKNEAIHLYSDTAVVIAVNSKRTAKFTWIAVKMGQRWRVVSETFSTVQAPQ